MSSHGFNCRCCGACCRIKGGIVRVSDAEVVRIAAFLGMSESDFIARETELAPDRKSLVLCIHEVVPHGWFNQWSSGLVFYHIL